MHSLVGLSDWQMQAVKIFAKPLSLTQSALFFPLPAFPPFSKDTPCHFFLPLKWHLATRFWA